MTRRPRPVLTSWRHRCKYSPLQRSGRLFAWVATDFGQACPNCGAPDPDVARREAQHRRATKLAALGHCHVNVEIPKGDRAELRMYAKLLRDRHARRRAAPCPAQRLQDHTGTPSLHIPVRSPAGLTCCKCGEHLGD